jgi:hypothetical protein
LAPGHSLPLQARAVFEGEHQFGPVLAEVLAVELLDECRQRQLS